MEFLTHKTLCLRSHVLESKTSHALFLGKHFRAQRMQDDWVEILVNANTLLQGDDLVPVAHSLFLTTAYQRVDGCRRKAGGIKAFCIYRHMQVGDCQVLVILVLTVHINDLTDDAHRTAHVFGYLRRSLHSDADNDVGSHLAGNVGRIVILQATVH